MTIMRGETLVVHNNKSGRSKGPVSLLSLVICFTFLLSLLSNAAAGSVLAAKSSRLAVITDVGGYATVQAAGASTAYEAYSNMGLNEGDYIETGSDSYVVLKLSDSGTQYTIGSNSEIYISELAKKGSGKKSKLKMWAGSVWSSVKKLVSDDDEEEIETPTAVMGVRGTQFFISVDPKTGESKLVVASGVVRTTTLTSTENKGTRRSLQDTRYVDVYPSQQIVLDNRNQVQDLKLKVETVDPAALVGNASPKVLEALIKNKAEIDAENAELLKRINEGLANGTGLVPEGSATKVTTQDELSRLQNNLQNLVGNIAREALDQKKISSQDMNKIVTETNSKIAEEKQKLDLLQVKDLVPNAGIDAALEKARLDLLAQLEADKKRLAEEEAKKQAELLKKLEQLIASVQQQMESADTQNQQLEQAQESAAEQQYVQSLPPEEQVKYMENKAELEGENTTPTNGGTTTGTGGTPAIPPSVAFSKDGSGNLVVNASNVKPMAIQMHFTTQTKLTAGTPTSGYFTGINAYLSGFNEYADGNGNYEYVFAALYNPMSTSLNPSTVMMKVPVTNTSGTVKLEFVKIILPDNTELTFSPAQIVNLAN
jgi:hypothetical protein